MSDSYPEYLNPFAEDVKPKSRLSISHSFKELKKTLRQSFRIKKKEEEPVTIRQKTDTIRRLPLSYPVNQRDALPRSRFQQRVRGEPSPSTSAPNPFEEDEENKNSKKLTMRRKTKKKAPLPPKSLSSQDVNNDNMEDSSRGSHWSLTSADTSYSDSVRDSGGDQTVDQAVLEKVIDFNKKMGQLKDDSNNNNIITNEDINQKSESNSDIPETEVITCPKETDSTLTCHKETESTLTCPKETDSTLTCPKETDSTLTCHNETDSTLTCSKETDSTLTCSKETGSSQLEIDKEENHLPKDHSENNLDCSSSARNSNEVLVVNDITKNEICENGTNDTTDNEKNGTANDTEEPFLYYEKQSLYIAGSRDELNDSNTYRVSIHIANDDDLDACNNNSVCDENQSDNNENDGSTPIPKQRKNKLTKKALLGV